MERANSTLIGEATSLFQLYDRAGIGEISKCVLLLNFSMIDGRITEEWLNKILLEHGTPLRPYITCAHFVQIMQALTAVADQPSDEDSP